MSLISAENTLLLWAFLMIAAGAAIYIEQNVRWASKVPGAVIALLIALTASNLGIIPTEAPAYDVVWGYIVPLAIPLLLFQLDLDILFKGSRRLLLLFLMSSAGTMIGTVVAFNLLKGNIPELDKIAGIISASYTGGGVNFAAMTARLEPSETIMAATIVADNLMMASYFFILIAIASSLTIRKIWGSPYQDKLETAFDENKNLSAEYWSAKPISLQSIAMSMGASALLVATAFTLSAFLKDTFGETNNAIFDIIFGLVSDKYLLLTTLTLIVITTFKERVKKLDGSQELGTYGIYLFFVVIGISASIPLIIQNAPLLFAFTFLIAIINLAITMICGKIFKFSIEEIVLACNANIGGPTTAAALAIGKGWQSLVGPILLIGTLGYVIGNYIGMFIYSVVN